METYNFPVTWPTRRKKTGNICTWCGERIVPGVTYASWGQVHEGVLSRVTMHNACYLLGWQHTEADEFFPGEMERGSPEHKE